MLKMHEILTKDFSKKGAGDVLHDTAGWKEKEAFYTDGIPNLGWALTSKEVIEDSTSKNYLEQSLEIAEYLEREVFIFGSWRCLLQALLSYLQLTKHYPRQDSVLFVKILLILSSLQASYLFHL
ncbi:MAG: hypothetical protein U9R06_02260 [Patescibacteria group bacterium]|nr:hypothetical protein [Patescibacteria group bacterium]